MNDFDTKDYFTDPSFVADPHPFFDHHRSKCPVRRLEASQNVIAVTGYDEVLAVLRDTANFSNIVAPIGPFPPLPFTVDGDDINGQIDAHREQFPMYEHLVTMDPPQHSRTRRLVSGLFTPRRLDENEHFMWELSDRLIDQFHASGKFEALFGYGVPFALLTIADLLGVPAEHHESFARHLNAQKVGSTEGESLGTNLSSSWTRSSRPSSKIADANRVPTPSRFWPMRSTPMGKSPTWSNSSGSPPSFSAPARTPRAAHHLDAAPDRREPRSPEAATRRPQPDPSIHRRNASYGGPVKSDFRLARRTTTVGDVQIPAGTVVMVSLPAANRDPARFENPHELRIDRENAREHVAFGRGVHSCPGGPLARVEARVTIERILDRMHDIRVSEAEHGPAHEREFRYEPTYILRGLAELHLEFTPVG